MTAVPELGAAGPAVAFAPGAAASASHRRLVAVAVSPMELLRPGSDLARLLESGNESDLLLACEDVPARGSGSVLGRLGGWCDEPPDTGDLDRLGTRCDPDDPDDRDDDAGDEVRAAAARLELPDLQLHRLGLRAPLGPAAESDLVAALSELVGFDPEPGVYCLAPAPAPGDPTRTAVERAAQRIAQVYGLPLLRYRCLELSVVGVT